MGLDEGMVAVEGVLTVTTGIGELVVTEGLSFFLGGSGASPAPREEETDDSDDTGAVGDVTTTGAAGLAFDLAWDLIGLVTTGLGLFGLLLGNESRLTVVDIALVSPVTGTGTALAFDSTGAMVGATEAETFVAEDFPTTDSPPLTAVGDCFDGSLEGAGLVSVRLAWSALRFRTSPPLPFFRASPAPPPPV